MLSEATLAEVPEFIAKKQAQWQRIAGGLPGLQLIVFGERRSSFAIAISTEDVEEQVIIGQLPHVILRPANGRRGAALVDIPNDDKPIDRRRIDLSDNQIDAIIGRWSYGQSASGLSFVAPQRL